MRLARIVRLTALTSSLFAGACAKHTGTPDGDGSSGETAATSSITESGTDTSTSSLATSTTVPISTGSSTNQETADTSADAGNVDAGTKLRWYQTCGDPVCRDETRDSGVAECAAKMVEGSACTEAGVQCDAHLGCGALLICASRDPRQAPGGCPISRARFKRNVEYVTDAQREVLAKQVLELPLATYTYREDPDQKQQLGFILEDVEPSLVVDSKRDQVNLYAYTSSVLAALQEQQKEIERLREQVRRLEMRTSTGNPMLECSGPTSD